MARCPGLNHYRWQAWHVVSRSVIKPWQLPRPRIVDTHRLIAGHGNAPICPALFGLNILVIAMVKNTCPVCWVPCPYSLDRL